MKTTKAMTDSTKAYVTVKKGEPLTWNGEELKCGLIYTADREEYPFWGYAKFIDAFASTSGAGGSTNFEAQYYEVMMYDYWIDEDDPDDIEIYGSKNIQILREIRPTDLYQITKKYIVANDDFCEEEKRIFSSGISEFEAYQSDVGAIRDYSVVGNIYDGHTACSGGSNSVAASVGDSSSAIVGNAVNSIASNSGRAGIAIADGMFVSATATQYAGFAAAFGSNVIATTSGNCSSSAAHGEVSVAAGTGKNAIISSCGLNAIAASNGKNSKSKTSGEGSVAIASGYLGTAITTDPKGTAIAYGPCSTARGVKGSVLVLTEWTCLIDPKTTVFIERICNWQLKKIKVVQVDGENIKENTDYIYLKGNIREANYISRFDQTRKEGLLLELLQDKSNMVPNCGSALTLKNF